ncbi:acyl carrier protein [Oligella ureolytica]
MDSIEQRVKGIIAEQLAIKDESEVKNESSFLDDFRR